VRVRLAAATGTGLTAPAALPVLELADDDGDEQGREPAEQRGHG
jgi:hypothetical protein